MQDRCNRRRRANRFMGVLIGAAAAGIAFTGVLAAQSSSRPAEPVADLNQLMRGLFFPHSNVLFSTQRQDPAGIKGALEPSGSSDPLTGVFGKWEAVENSALVIAEGADLLMEAGRKCSNGRDVPLAKPDWPRLVNQLREAGMVAFKAAQSKNLDNMIKATDVLNTSCQECHNKYRPRNNANRCQ